MATNPPSGNPRTRARRAARRQAILDAAEALDGGFTTEELAAAAGIGQGSVFYYFRGGRSEIEAALALRRFWALQAEWRAAAEAAPDGVSALVAVLGAMQGQYERDPDWFGVLLEAQLRGPWPPELLAEHAEVVGRLYALLERRLAEDRAAGRLHPEIEDLRRYARTIIGAGTGELTHAAFIARAGGSPRSTLRDAMGDLVALVRRGSRA